MENKTIVKCEVVTENKKQLFVPNNINKEDIRTYSYTNKNGKEITEINLHNNISLKQKIYSSGVIVENRIKIPKFKTILERNIIIMDMTKNNHTQEEIAKVIGLKQSSISRIIIKDRKINN